MEIVETPTTKIVRLPGDAMVDYFDLQYANDSLKLDGCITHTCAHSSCKRRQYVFNRKYDSKPFVEAASIDCTCRLENQATTSTDDGDWLRHTTRREAVQNVNAVRRDIEKGGSANSKQSLSPSTSHGFASSPFTHLFDVDRIEKRGNFPRFECDPDSDNILRIPFDHLSRAQFVERFEKGSRPAILTGGGEDFDLHDGGRGTKDLWSCEALLSRFSSDMFKCGVTSQGEAIPIRLRDYLQYAARDCDGEDSPMYIFDDLIEQRQPISDLLQNYRIPHVFNDDLLAYGRDEFDPADQVNYTQLQLCKYNVKDRYAMVHGEYRMPQLVDGRKRGTTDGNDSEMDDVFPPPAPPHRWLVLGGRRSGTSMHQDPLATCAWNALLHGSKRWILFPPSTPLASITPPSEEKATNEQTSVYGSCAAVEWFARMERRLADGEWPAGCEPIECIQRAGETIFVPSGWWHCVLNISRVTVAVTQNLCTTANFAQVMAEAREKRPDFAKYWEERLKRMRPDIRMED